MAADEVQEKVARAVGKESSTFQRICCYVLLPFPDLQKGTRLDRPSYLWACVFRPVCVCSCTGVPVLGLAPLPPEAHRGEGLLLPQRRTESEKQEARQ